MRISKNDVLLLTSSMYSEVLPRTNLKDGPNLQWIMDNDR